VSFKAVSFFATSVLQNGTYDLKNGAHKMMRPPLLMVFNTLKMIGSDVRDFNPRIFGKNTDGKLQHGYKLLLGWHVIVLITNLLNVH